MCIFYKLAISIHKVKMKEKQRMEIKNRMMAVENGSQASESKTVADKKQKDAKNKKEHRIGCPYIITHSVYIINASGVVYHPPQAAYHQRPWVLYIIRRGRHIIRPLRSASRERD